MTQSEYSTLQSRVEDCKYVAQIVCGECGKGSVCGIQYQNPLSHFADMEELVTSLGELIKSLGAH
jgi:hypothetical protein